LTETSTEPLKAELIDLEKEILDQIAMNAAIKNSLIANEEKVVEMIHRAAARH